MIHIANRIFFEKFLGAAKGLYELCLQSIVKKYILDKNKLMTDPI